jgi:hypothetical protein
MSKMIKYHRNIRIITEGKKDKIRKIKNYLLVLPYGGSNIHKLVDFFLHSVTVKKTHGK